MKIKLNKITIFLKKIARVLAENSFITLLALFIIALGIGALLFYKYIILVQKTQPQITEKPIQFKEKTYESILQIWGEREQKFQATQDKKYPNPFYSATSTKPLTQ